MDIENTAVVVTGGASGLGAATARRFAASGATVFALDLAQANDVAERVSGVCPVACDIVDTTSVAAALAQVAEVGVPLRVVVNCAGVGWAGRIVSKHGPHDLDLFRRVLEVNVIGTFNVMRLAAEMMTTQPPVDADGQRGVIIMTSSVAAFEGQIGQIAYTASKGAVHAMTISAARDLARTGVRVCTIAPGTVDTPMLASVSAEVRAGLAEAVPFPARLGRPDEYADLAAFIAEHDYLNGETIRMDGAIRMAPR